MYQSYHAVFFTKFIFCLLVVVFLSTGTCFAQDEWTGNCPESFSIPLIGCSADTLSWVAFTSEESKTDIIKKKGQIERTMRSEAKKHIPILQHEILPFDEAMAKHDFAPESIDLTKKVGIYCHLWTVGNIYPIAYHINCSMRSYGYDGGVNYEYKDNAYLGYCNEKDLYAEVVAALSKKIKGFGTKFYKQIDYAKLQASPNIEQF